jgi:hypothetical protein
MSFDSTGANPYVPICSWQRSKSQQIRFHFNTFYEHLVAFRADQLDNLRENRCAEARHCIPTLRHREASSVATTVTSAQNVSEAFVTLLVEPWVHEAQGGLACGDECVVDKSENRCHQRRRSRCAGDDGISGVVEELEVETLGGNIGVATATDVVKTLICHVC